MLEIIQTYPILSFMYLLFVAAVIVYTAWSLYTTHGYKQASRKAMEAIASGDVPTSFHYITPQQAVEYGDTRSLEELIALSRTTAHCEACGAPAWRYSGTGLCFPCTTGETDASRDYELMPYPLVPGEGEQTP